MKVKDKSLERMLRTIARTNKISKVDIAIYDPLPHEMMSHYDCLDEIDIKRGFYGIIETEVSRLNNINALKEEYVINIKKEKIESGSFRNNYLIGISSKVKLKDNNHSNLFLLDFGCEITDKNQKNIRDFVRDLKVTPGFIVNSGNSYHYYSSKLYDNSKCTQLLNEAKSLSSVLHPRKSKLDETFVDENWIKIQLKKGYSVLRISKNELKDKMPRVIESVDFKADDPNQTYLFEDSK